MKSGLAGKRSGGESAGRSERRRAPPHLTPLHPPIWLPLPPSVSSDAPCRANAAWARALRRSPTQLGTPCARPHRDGVDAWDGGGFHSPTRLNACGPMRADRETSGGILRNPGQLGWELHGSAAGHPKPLRISDPHPPSRRRQLDGPLSCPVAHPRIGAHRGGRRWGPPRGGIRRPSCRRRGSHAERPLSTTRAPACLCLRGVYASATVIPLRRACFRSFVTAGCRGKDFHAPHVTKPSSPSFPPPSPPSTSPSPCILRLRAIASVLLDCRLLPGLPYVPSV